MTQLTDEQSKGVKEIERWLMLRTSAHSDPYADLSRALGYIRFLIPLLDSASQTARQPTGWISCGLRHGHDRIVDIVFENAECAKEFIDGVEPVTGPIIAAAAMRDKCVEITKRENPPHNCGLEFGRGFARAKKIIAGKLESLTLDQVEQEAKQ